MKFRQTLALLVSLTPLLPVDAFVAPARSSQHQQQQQQQQRVLTPLSATRPSKHHDDDDGMVLSTLRERAVAAVFAATLVFLAPSQAALADGQTKEFKFPPIDFSDKQRCVLKSSSMGQANAARDSLFDLRQCQLAGVKAAGFDLSGAGACFAWMVDHCELDSSSSLPPRVLLELFSLNFFAFSLLLAVMTKTDASKADFRETYFSKGYLRGK